jgi:hypothetical protein
LHRARISSTGVHDTDGAGAREIRCKVKEATNAQESPTPLADQLNSTDIAASAKDTPDRSITERIEYMEVRLVSLEAIGGDQIRASIELTNRSGDTRGLAIAFKAQGSGGIADYWEFMLYAMGSLTDDRGNRFPLSSAAGIGFARTNDDWAMLSNGSSVTMILDFSTAESRKLGSQFALAVEIYVAWRDTAKIQHNGPYVIQIRNAPLFH